MSLDTVTTVPLLNWVSPCLSSVALENLAFIRFCSSCWFLLVPSAALLADHRSLDRLASFRLGGFILSCPPPPKREPRLSLISPSTVGSTPTIIFHNVPSMWGKALSSWTSHPPALAGCLSDGHCCTYLDSGNHQESSGGSHPLNSGTCLQVLPFAQIFSSLSSSPGNGVLVDHRSKTLKKKKSYDL